MVAGKAIVEEVVTITRRMADRTLLVEAEVAILVVIRVARYRALLE
jgi:hypothetical protein